jgi:hypothetical protein
VSGDAQAITLKLCMQHMGAQSELSVVEEVNIGHRLASKTG